VNYSQPIKMSQRSSVTMPKQSEQGRKKNPSNKRTGDGPKQQKYIKPQDTEDESRNKLIVPPTRFKLTKLTPAQTLTQIGQVTQGFFDLPIDDVVWIQNDIRSREFSSFGSLLAHEVPEIHEKVVGKNNHFLDLTRHKHKVAYIGYDSEENAFHFWGEYQSCIKAMNAIRYRIYAVEDRASREFDEDLGVAELEQKIAAVRIKLDRENLSATPPPPNDEYLLPRSVSCGRSMSIRQAPCNEKSSSTPAAYE